MQLTFILGNGFDKAIEMHTGYEDFYNWYVKEPYESEDVELMKREINKYLENKKDKKEQESTWADFEIALGQFTNVITDKVRFIEVFKKARLSLVRYLSNEYAKAVAENKDFLKSTTYRLVELSQKLSEDLPEDRKQLFSIYKENKTTFNCISFNYTPILRDGAQDMIDNAGGISNRDGWWGTYEIGKTLNVHGQLDDFPILGVDNSNQIANECFRNDPDILQLMVKGEIDKKLGRNWRKDAQEIISNSDKIYVYGASLGETDEFWWKTIAQWFEVDIDNHQLALYCHSDATGDELEEKQQIFVKNISKHFTSSDYSSNIVVDSKKKTMTVKFAYAAAQMSIKTGVYAAAEALPAAEYYQNKG